MQTSPISTCRPVASMISPIRSRHAADAGGDRSASSIACAARARPPERVERSVIGCIAVDSRRIRARRVDDLAGAGELGRRCPRRSRRRRCARSRRRGRSARSDWTPRCSIPPSSDWSCSTRLADELEVAGVDDERHAPAVDQVAQRVAADVDARARAGPRSRRRGSARRGGAPARRRPARARRRAGRAARSIASTRGGHRGQRRLRASARAAASPAARPSASPAAHACGADLLGLGAGRADSTSAISARRSGRRGVELRRNA